MKKFVLLFYYYNDMNGTNNLFVREISTSEYPSLAATIKDWGYIAHKGFKKTNEAVSFSQLSSCALRCCDIYQKLIHSSREASGSSSQRRYYCCEDSNGIPQAMMLIQVGRFIVIEDLVTHPGNIAPEILESDKKRAVNHTPTRGSGSALVGKSIEVAHQVRAEGVALVPTSCAKEFYQKRGFVEWLNPPEAYANYSLVKICGMQQSRT